MYNCIYIYIERERERCYTYICLLCIYLCVYIYIYIYICICILATPQLPARVTRSSIPARVWPVRTASQQEFIAQSAKQEATNFIHTHIRIRIDTTSYVYTHDTLPSLAWGEGPTGGSAPY